MNNVLMLRQSYKMTQDEFSEHCNVSRISIARYESGAEVSRVNAKKIAEACGVSISYVLGEKPPVSTDPWNPETMNAAEQDDKTIRIMTRGMKRITQENRQKLLDVARALYPKDFDEEGNKRNDAEL